MSIFNKSKTVLSVFEKAVSEVKEIKNKQKIESDRLRQQNTDLLIKYKEESDKNKLSISAAEKEMTTANSVIEKFESLFCIKK